MLLDTVIGDNNYVSGTGYDSPGRITSARLAMVSPKPLTIISWDEKATVDSQLVGQGGRMKSITVGALQNMSYLYDAVGNVRQITNLPANETNNYGYDALNRLTSWTLNNQTETYGYNPATGNLATKAGMSLQYNDAHMFTE